MNRSKIVFVNIPLTENAHTSSIITLRIFEGVGKKKEDNKLAIIKKIRQINIESQEETSFF